jgi:(1->4)-alpha-D-glucan 1-alpha-D-glucosylmutase
VAVIVPRLAMGLRGGWGDTTVELPHGRWVDQLGGSTADEGPVSLAALLSGFPVALLVRN